MQDLHRMSFRYTVILNPTAGHGRAASFLQEIEAAFEEAGADFEIELTRYPGHARELAEERSQEGRAIIAAGGDGTVQEVGAGLAAAGHVSPMGIIPVGTGNDYVKMIGVPSGPVDAVRRLLKAEVRYSDYGRVRYAEGETVSERLFFNAVGIGFDGMVASVMHRYKRFRGWHGYLLAVLVTLRRWKYPLAHVRGRVETTEVLNFEGDILLVTAANGQSTGGGFYLTKEASAFDGRLDLCLIERVSLATIARLIPRVLRKRDLDSPEVHQTPITFVRLDAPAIPLPMHADGETLSAGCSWVEVEIVPGAMPVLVPPQ
jgi:diacylglycerol kinase (ATP)